MLSLTHLIGCDSYELRLRENERLLRSPWKLGELAAADDVQAWLVLMHAGQNDLEMLMETISNPFKRYTMSSLKLTCPLLSSVLLVSLTLLKSNAWDCQWAPVAGLSGCRYMRCGLWGSAPPAGTHWEPENL